MNLSKPIIALILIVFSIPANLLAGNFKNIVIIHSYSKISPWVSDINDSFKETIEQLGTKVKLNSIYFHVDKIMREAPDRLKKEKQKIIEFLKKKKPDSILLCDDEATNILMPALMKFGAPVFFTGVNNLEMSWKLDKWKHLQAGVIEIYPIEEALDFVKKVKPNCKKISILSSKSTSSQIVTKNIVRILNTKKIKNELGIKLQKIYLLEKYSEWENVVSGIEKENDALFVLVPYEVIDESGQEVHPEKIGRLLKSNLSIPTLGIISIHTRIGLFASISVGGKGLGRQSAEQIHKYFNGEKIERIGFENIRYYNFEINATEARRLNIDIPSEFYGLTVFID